MHAVRLYVIINLKAEHNKIRGIKNLPMTPGGDKGKKFHVAQISGYMVQTSS